MGSDRGTAHHLLLGRFAVPDPDDDDRMTYWRVEAVTATGSRKELRPWPAEVRWAPMRPPYPPDLDKMQRKEWADLWYSEVYFEWKQRVIDAIAADPQGAADEFARSAPTAELPAPVKKRPRVQVRPKRISAKQREIEAQKLMAEALRRAGMSQRQLAVEMGLPKTTVHRRLSGKKVADGLAQVFLEARIASLIAQVLEAARTATEADLPRLQAQLEQVRSLQAKAIGAADVAPPAGLGVFGPRLVDRP